MYEHLHFKNVAILFINTGIVKADFNLIGSEITLL